MSDLAATPRGMSARHAAELADLVRWVMDAAAAALPPSTRRTYEAYLRSIWAVLAATRPENVTADAARCALLSDPSIDDALLAEVLQQLTDWYTPSSMRGVRAAVRWCYRSMGLPAPWGLRCEAVLADQRDRWNPILPRVPPRSFEVPLATCDSPSAGSGGTRRGPWS